MSSPQASHQSRMQNTLCEPFFFKSAKSLEKLNLFWVIYNIFMVINLKVNGVFVKTKRYFVWNCTTFDGLDRGLTTWSKRSSRGPYSWRLGSFYLGPRPYAFKSLVSSLPGPYTFNPLFGLVRREFIPEHWCNMYLCKALKGQ